MGIKQWVRRDQPATLLDDAVADDVPSDMSNNMGNEMTSEMPREMTKNLDSNIDKESIDKAETMKEAAIIETPVPVIAEAAAKDWSTLKQQVAACTRCALHKSRDQTVFGVGNENAQWMVVGEAPGAKEDEMGEPFVGRAGALLDEMLLSIGLSRNNNVYIANILKCRPPENRNPTEEESLCCESYLQAQIKLLKPKLILAVGGVAAHSLLKNKEPLGKLRGKQLSYGEQNTPLVVTYHPAYLLRSPTKKRLVWEDLLFAKKLFEEL